MDRMRTALGTLVGLLVVVAMVWGLSLVFDSLGPAPGGGRATETAAVTPNPYPPPTEIGQGSFPTEAVIEMEGDATPLPTGTPLSTLPPADTPTPLPGATVTPLPMQRPAADAAGTLWFTVRLADEGGRSYEHRALPVGPDGLAAGGPAPFSGLESALGEAGERTHAVRPSPASDLLLFLLEVEPLSEPVILDLSTGEVRRPLMDYAPGQFLGWHPDGRRFLFFVDGGGPWLVDAETSEITKLALETLIQGGAISPDGTTVAYVADAPDDAGEGESGDSLWRVSVAGGDARAVASLGPGARLYPTSWSPDGTCLLYSGMCSEGGVGLCVLDLGSGQTRALSLPYAGFNPVWSPDGRQVAATGRDPAEAQCPVSGLDREALEDCLYQTNRIYVEDLGSGEVRALAAGLQPAWSPDGAFVAFLSNQSGQTEVWRASIAGGKLEQLTRDGLRKEPSLIWKGEMSK